MSVLLSCESLSKIFASKPLFEGISFGVNEGDRLSIIGPNGSGKSTLLKILAGSIDPDDGRVSTRKGLNLIYVPQETDFKEDQSPRQIITKVLAETTDEDEYQIEVRVTKILSRVGFAEEAPLVKDLSGGWKKRLAIACALVRSPDVLLLDEPTNHLDVEGILWLEKTLLSASFACVLISHDRYFLENVSSRTIEINRVYPGGIFCAEGAYSQFLNLKAEFLSGQQQQHASLANKVRREVEWLRQGAKARTTKQQARGQNAEKLQEELQELSARNKQQSVDFDFSASGRKTKKLLAMVEVSKSFAGKSLLRNLNLVLSPGLRIGLLGLNASGKSTLLKIMAGIVPIDSGKLELADQLRLVYFDQNRDSLDLNLSLKKTLAPDSDSVVIGGRNIHVASYAKKFLFRPDQLDVPIAKFSGGERARVQIAKLLLNPADVLLLDEPTNDLDIPTLEVLEESILEFPGAVVLVTHDRFMLDRVSTKLLALDGSGGCEYFADFAQWQAHQDFSDGKQKKESNPINDSTPRSKVKPTKRSYKEQREYEQMESTILAAENELEKCRQEVESPTNASNSIRLQESYRALQKAQQKVDDLYARWAVLEDIGSTNG